MKKFLSLIIITLVATTMLVAQKRYDLRYNLKEGVNYQIVSSSNTTTQMSMMGRDMNIMNDITNYSTLSATNVTKDSLNVSMRTDRMVFSFSIPMSGVSKSFDSANDNDSNDPNFAKIKQIIGKAITATIRPNGEVIGKINTSQYGSLSDKIHSSSIMPIEYPNHPIAIGEKWKARGGFFTDVNTETNADVLYNYQLTKYNEYNNTYTILVTAEMDLESNNIPITADLEGTLYVDADTGLLLSTSKFTLDGSVDTLIKGQDVHADISGTINMGWRR